MVIIREKLYEVKVSRTVLKTSLRWKLIRLSLINIVLTDLKQDVFAVSTLASSVIVDVQYSSTIPDVALINS